MADAQLGLLPCGLLLWPVVRSKGYLSVSPLRAASTTGWAHLRGPLGCGPTQAESTKRTTPPNGVQGWGGEYFELNTRRQLYS